MTSTTTPALDLPTLTTYLDGMGVPRQGALRTELISGGRSNLTFLVFDDVSTWVLRRPPTSGVTPSAHDMAREYHVVSALQSTSVPVARPVALCEDAAVLGAPFTLVQYVTGRVIRTEDDLASIASDEALRGCVSALVAVLAELHSVDPNSVGLGNCGRPQGYLERQVQRWGKQWQLVCATDDSRSGDVERLRSALADRVPSQGETAIVHGDYRIDNTILDSTHADRVRAVVDWEMSTLGDPLADAALMCVYRDPAFNLVIGQQAAWSSPRMPSADELAQQYAAASGAALRHWSFYLSLGYFKLAVIAAGIDFRRRSGDGRPDPAGEAVALLIAEGLRRLNTSRD